MKKHSIFRKISLLLITALLMISLYVPAGAAAPPAGSYPVAVDGRILTPEMTGDISEWVEIAQNGKFSLIVRRNFINIYPYAVMGGKIWYNNPEVNFTTFGASSDYNKSIVRNKINDWFNGVAKGDADNLPVNARMRAYTHQVYPQMNMGTACMTASVVNGYSTPTKYQVGVGDEIAFALSYGESASFLSNAHLLHDNYVNGVYVMVQPSNAIAMANLAKINMFDNNHKFNMWLRSPGDSGKQVAFLHNKFGVTAGRTSMCPPTNGSNTITGLVYPAVWVDQEIFDMANSHRTPPAPITSFPVGVTGRTLTPDMSGDTSEWIEIAQNGEYSLLVRRHFINIYPHATQGSKIVYNDPEAQRSSFGVNTNYMESYIREDINRWFSGDAKLEAEKLPANARLRDYTVQTTVKYDIGTSSTHKGVVDGFSKPTHYQAGIGNDIAFLLSFSEVANFLSLRHHLRGVMVNGVHSPLAPSSAVAIANYNKIVFPGTFTRFNMWLRSVGDIAGQVGFLHNPHYVTSAGMAFQSHVGFNTIGGMAYPAVWVKSSIFGPTERQVTVVHHVPDETYYGPDDVYKEYSREYITAMDGDVLRSETYVIPEGPNFIYIYDEDKPTYLVVSNSDAVLDIFYKGPTG